MKTKTEITVQVAKYNADTFGGQYGGAIISAREVEMGNVEFTMLVDDGELGQIKELQEDGGVYITQLPCVQIQARNEDRGTYEQAAETLTIGELVKHLSTIAAEVGDAAPVYVAFERGKVHEITEQHINTAFLFL